MTKSTKFMFINKDAKSDSLSHSHKNERVQIHSHVQKGRRYKKSDGGIIYASQLPHLQPGRRSSNSIDSDEEQDYREFPRGRALTHEADSFLPRQRSPPLPATSHQYYPEEDSNIDPLLWNNTQARFKSVSPQSVPTFPASAEENFDPFDVTCIQVDESVHSLLQYFLRRFHPNIWHLERTVRSDHAYAFRYDAMNVVQGCLHDEYNMYAMLAHMHSYMHGIEGMTPTGDWGFYMHKALQASQNYVKGGNPITGRMVLNTFSLACAEWYRFNNEPAYIHLKAMKSMVDSIGGLSCLEAPVAELLLIGDAYVAGEMRKKPLWSDADFDNGDNHPMTAYALQELQNLLTGTVAIGSGLLRSAHHAIVPADLRWVILDLAVVLSVLRSTQTIAEHPPAQSPEGLHWTYIRSLAIRHRLLHLELEDRRSDVIRTATVLWMLLCFTVSGRKRSTKIIAPFLREVLLEISDDEWQRHKDVHLWVLTIGVQCATVGTEEHVWFVAEIDQVMDEAIQGSEKILIFLTTLSERFFYHDPAQKYLLRALANDLSDLRGARDKSKNKSTSKSKSPRS